MVVPIGPEGAARAVPTNQIGEKASAGPTQGTSSGEIVLGESPNRMSTDLPLGGGKSISATMQEKLCNLGTGLEALSGKFSTTRLGRFLSEARSSISEHLLNGIGLMSRKMFGTLAEPTRLGRLADGFNTRFDSTLNKAQKSVGIDDSQVMSRIETFIENLPESEKQEGLLLEEKLKGAIREQENAKSMLSSAKNLFSNEPNHPILTQQIKKDSTAKQELAEVIIEFNIFSSKMKEKYPERFKS